MPFIPIQVPTRERGLPGALADILRGFVPAQIQARELAAKRRAVEEDPEVIRQMPALDAPDEEWINFAAKTKNPWKALDYRAGETKRRDIKKWREETSGFKRIRYNLQVEKHGESVVNKAYQQAYKELDDNISYRTARMRGEDAEADAIFSERVDEILGRKEVVKKKIKEEVFKPKEKKLGLIEQGVVNAAEKLSKELGATMKKRTFANPEARKIFMINWLAERVAKARKVPIEEAKRIIKEYLKGQ
jgi:hypothetical protein